MRSLALSLVLLLVGCTQSLDAPEELPLAPNFLQLESYAAVSADGLSAAGFLRWVYTADDPSVAEEPREFCEIWERFDLERAEASACPSCTDVWTGSAAVDEADEATCVEATWEPRAYGLGFGALADADVTEEAAEGQSHAVWSTWAPDRGDLDGFELLYVATPERWSSETAPIGASGDRPVAGDYRLTSLYYWDVR